jgi:Arylsulfotransferase (ASST)
MERTQTRREFLAAAATGVAALTVPGRALAFLDAPKGVTTYVTEPSFRVPTLTVNTLASPAPGYVFATTLNGPGQRGPMILDNEGEIVWFLPLDEVPVNFRTQVYRGQTVLTWWQGSFTQLATGQGASVIVDDTYSQVAVVEAGNGYKADPHEFLLTPQGTALMTIYNPVTADLSSVGGSTSGTVLDSIVQEVDVASGDVLFEWHSLEHVPLTATYAPLLDPFDYFHVNSIDVHPDGDLIVSARNTSAVYKLDRKTGDVRWTLGGRTSDFQLGPRAFFMYQHDARAHPDGTLTLYDDGPSSSSQQSRAIRLGLDTSSLQALLLQEFDHPTPLMSSAMGNAQVLPNGNLMVGWGTEPYITEFDPLGDVRFDASFVGNAWNYRAFRNTWVARPAALPAIVARRRVGGATVHASWNGSTETAYWRVSGGPAANALEPLATVAATGFETAVGVVGSHRVLQATALDAGKRPLASSRAVRPA